MRSLRPFDIVVGAASGVIGMLAMDVLWWRRARRAGSDDGFVEWEFSTGTAFDSYGSAGAPAQIGHRLARLGGVELPTERAGLVTDVVHWATGVGWGVASGALVATTPVPAVPAGVVGGVAAVAVAYGALGAAGSTTRSGSTTQRRCGKTSARISCSELRPGSHCGHWGGCGRDHCG